LRFQRAHELTEKGLLEDALQEYRALLLDDPDNAQAYFEAGQVRVLQKKWNAAIRNFEMSLQKNPSHWDAAAGIAESYDQLGQRDKAIASWRKVADKGPASFRAHATARIEAILKQEKKEPMAGGASNGKSAKPPESKDSPKANQAEPSKGSGRYDSPDFIQGIADYQAGKWAKSLDSWRKVLAAEPTNPGAFYYAGVCRYNLSQLDKAEFNLTKSFAYPDKGYNAHYYLARIYEKQKHPAKARQQYESYLAKTSSPEGRKDVEKRLALLPAPVGSTGTSSAGASISSSFSATSSASSDSSAAKVVPPKPNPEKVVMLDIGVPFAIASLSGPGAAEMEKALKSAQVKDFSGAMDILKQIRLDFPGVPNALAAGYNLVALYDYLGLSDNMRVLSSTLLREVDVPEPYLSGLRGLLARSLKGLGELPAARSVLDSVVPDLALGPTTAQKLLLETQLAEMQKSEKEVPALLEKAIANEKDPLKRADLRLRLGQMLLRQGMQVNAEKVFNELLSSCSPYTTEQCRKALLAVADMQYQNKAWDKAISQYKKSVEGYPHPEDSPWGLYQIGNAYRQMKKWAESVAAYESLIQKYPESYWAEQAKWNREDVIWRGQNAQLLKGN
jgi:tetratricopeptide (TPR) repeat protein